MNVLRKISVRQLQHNLSDYLELAKIGPLTITKYGKEEVVMVNPKKFKITKMVSDKKPKEDIMASTFIGMYKNKKEWRGKSSIDIAENLKNRAWYGK